MCAALLCFSCLDATAKWVNRSVDPMVTVWARYMSALLTFMVINPLDAAGPAQDPPASLPAPPVLPSAPAPPSATSGPEIPAAGRDPRRSSLRRPLLVALLAGPILGERSAGSALPPSGSGSSASWSSRGRASAPCIPRSCCRWQGSVAYAFYNIVTGCSPRAIRCDHDPLFERRRHCPRDARSCPGSGPRPPRRSSGSFWPPQASWRLRALAAHSRPCPGPGGDPGALHLQPDHLDARLGLHPVRRLARFLDLRRGWHRHRIGALLALP